MGLDQSLEKIEIDKGYNIEDIIKLSKEDNDIYGPFLPARFRILYDLKEDDEIEAAFYEVAYWRKNHLIQEWINNNVGKVKNCEYLYMPKKALINLRNYLTTVDADGVSKRVVQLKTIITEYQNKEDITDLLENLLEEEQELEYFGDNQKSIEKLDEVIRNYNENTEGIFYYGSW